MGHFGRSFANNSHARLRQTGSSATQANVASAAAWPAAPQQRFPRLVLDSHTPHAQRSAISRSSSKAECCHSLAHISKCPGTPLHHPGMKNSVRPRTGHLMPLRSMKVRRRSSDTPFSTASPWPSVRAPNTRPAIPCAFRGNDGAIACHARLLRHSRVFAIPE